MGDTQEILLCRGCLSALPTSQVGLAELGPAPSAGLS